METSDLSILLVDDSQMNVRLLEELLFSAGFTNVTGTTNPYDVLDYCAEEEPDLVLTDLKMPDLDGYQLLKLLRARYPEKTYLPVLVITGSGDEDAMERSLTLGANDYLTKPFSRTEVILRVKNLLETRVLHKKLRDYNQDLEDKVKDRTGRLWRAVTQLEQSERQVRLSQQETVTRLSIAAEFRDDETARHIKRMSHYCGLLARCSGMEEKKADLLRMASEMHDVGKIGVPDSILLKPGRLTPEERTVMEQHPDIGYRILRDSESELLQVAATVALSHHERIDGKGYPQGLAGDEIPLEARIAAVADVFDALTTDRIYRGALELDTALDIMKEGRGTQFDADLLDLFFEKMDDVLAIKSENDDISVKQPLNAAV